MEQDRLGDGEVPGELARHLRSAFPTGPGIASRVDAAVLGAAKRRAAAGRLRRRMRIGAWGLSAAAGLALAAVVWVWGGGPTRGQGGPAGGASGAGGLAMDMNGDGVVDIVDALILERAVARHDGRDVNGDGVADQKDVDRIAMSAVNLGKGG